METTSVFPYFKSQLKLVDSFVKQLFKKLEIGHKRLCMRLSKLQYTRLIHVLFSYTAIQQLYLRICRWCSLALIQEEEGTSSFQQVRREKSHHELAVLSKRDHIQEERSSQTTTQLGQLIIKISGVLASLLYCPYTETSGYQQSSSWKSGMLMRRTWLKLHMLISSRKEMEARDEDTPFFPLFTALTIQLCQLPLGHRSSQFSEGNI